MLMSRYNKNRREGEIFFYYIEVINMSYNYIRKRNAYNYCIIKCFHRLFIFLDLLSYYYYIMCVYIFDEVYIMSNNYVIADY